MSDSLFIECPLYLLQSVEPCWKCKAEQVVHALACHQLTDDGSAVMEPGDTSDLILLQNITAMPPGVFRYLNQKNGRYMQRFSRTAGGSYYANTCACGANFGDFYLFSEPGGAFFPDTDEAARLIVLEITPFTGILEFSADYSMGIGETILRLARRTG